MSRKAWNEVKKPDMLECLKTFRANGQPPKVMVNWKEAVNIETLKIEELKSGFEKMDVDETEMAQLLGIAETRENLIVMAIATILTALKISGSHNPGAGIDKVSIKERIVELDSLIGSKKYVKQKDRLQTDVEKFLEEYSKSTIDKATPHDMRAFLVYKESCGKTKVHRKDCLVVSGTGCHCECLLDMSANSVDSLIGKLRAIFRDRGRGSKWDADLGTGNPLASLSIKNHLKALKMEQLQADVIPIHAVPLFLDKAAKLDRYLEFYLTRPLLIREEYLVRRDKAFIKFICHSGDRAGDLANLRTDQIKQTEKGLLVRMTQGKTIKQKLEYFV
ncbi:hypothetical protein LOTGIDRAFT_175377 [Lottia gigantea]|uniref:ALOG domain-containing protein n=1 Tax=Lottia gigantea TaxID=225164 RepID=V4BZS0_LOTGI|nr:hypothetical protein LOTGIDRAFT_175377 [Lottia gigantea]ESO94659.1 hypothetical protein LOTGIDRAFT_175377 [Lottia gigantea]